MPQTNTVLERNLEAIRRYSPDAAKRIANATARTDLEFTQTDDGVPSAMLGNGPEARALASRRRPLEEGHKLAATVDLKEAGGIVVLGFGLGYHVKAMSERIGKSGVVVVFEPDVALLRAVFEHVDHSQWLNSANVAILTDPEDSATMASIVRGVEGLLAIGVKIVEHIPSRARLGPTADRFTDQFTRVMRAVRTTVLTTLMQVEVTIRNLLMNLDHYSTGSGIHDLQGAAKGRAAVVVSAGPSLRRNLDLLAQPGVRDRVVIIAVQTVLKTMLERGIRPHYVTALDYHEISRRFYEGLTPEDVEGVTLVVEPKANAAILDSFPGRIRCAGDDFLDSVVGPKFAREMGRIQPGATVAHLAYYLARHLGCDPVILIGQDLGFTDGQYYSAGAAIHQTWSSELNDFDTLEMHEWQRIVRGRKLLHKTKDILGRSIYADEQMNNYLLQFERDFRTDSEQKGLRIIDATEGGVAKQHTTVRTLADALDEFAVGDPIQLPETVDLDEPRTARLSKTAQRVRRLQRDVWRIGDGSRRTHKLLSELSGKLHDKATADKLFSKIESIRSEVVKLDPAYNMVQHLNQTGSFKRIRADREIELEEGLSDRDRQIKRLERDMMNLEWLADCSDQMGKLLSDAAASLGGEPKITRDPAPKDDGVVDGDGNVQILEGDTRKIIAMIPVDPKTSGLGTSRDLDAPFMLGRNPLELTLMRLAQCKKIDGVALLCQNIDEVRSLAGPIPPGLDVTFVKTEQPPMGTRLEGIRGGRLWATSCWRGGIAGLTCYDEVCNPLVLAPLMNKLQISAAVLLGPDWALVDPDLADAVVDRHIERPSLHRFVFCQAPPGLAPALLSRSMMNDMADRAPLIGAFSAIGGALGYVPAAPQSDDIAKPWCVAVSPCVRDLPLRCIIDEPGMNGQLAAALDDLSDQFQDLRAEQIAQAIGQTVRQTPAPSPQRMTLELTTRRTGAGLRSAWTGHDGTNAQTQDIELNLAKDIIEQFAAGRSDAALTLDGRGDSLLHPHWQEIVGFAKQRGVTVHLRTDLLCADGVVEELIKSGVDVISVDLMAATADVYKHVVGTRSFDVAQTNLNRLIELRKARPMVDGLRVPWIVPRITRCDRVYEQIESFYDKWIMSAGACVIDPLPRAIEGERIEPLPVPEHVTSRRGLEQIVVRCDGTVVDSDGGDLSEGSLVDIWPGTAEQIHEDPEQLESAVRAAV